MNDYTEDKIIQKNEESCSLSIKLQSEDSSSNNEDEVAFSSKLIKTVFESKTNKLNKDSNSKNYDSGELKIKKSYTLFDSRELSKPKSKYLKSLEFLSTDQGSIKVNNYNSHKKKYSIFKLIEKDKKLKKDIFQLYDTRSDKEQKKERTDAYGNIINRKNRKKVKVSFVDKISSQKLANIIDIESFKKYNYIEGMPKEEKMNNLTTFCQCCTII